MCPLLVRFQVYSYAENRWIHVDPCEAVMDAPMTYEVGWGKKLTYCMAVSKDEVQDVTSRYTVAKDQAERDRILARRTLVTESWLTKAILELNNLFQQRLNEDDKKRVNERRLVRYEYKPGFLFSFLLF